MGITTFSSRLMPEPLSRRQVRLLASAPQPRLKRIPLRHYPWPEVDSDVFDAWEQLQLCITSGDVNDIDAILAPFQDPETPELLKPAICELFVVGPLVAMRTGQFQLAQKLLDKGIGVDYCCATPATAHALATDSTSVLEMLLAHGWEIDEALMYLDAQTLKSLLYKYAFVQWFLSHGADPNFVDRTGITPMSYIARYAPLSSLQLIVDHGGRVQSTDTIVNAVLGHAQGEPDRLEVVRYLLDRGAPIDAFHRRFCDPEKCMGWIMMGGGLTGLHHAAKAGKEDMVALLLQHGANTKLESSERKTAMDLAVEYGHERIATLLRESMARVT